MIQIHRKHVIVITRSQRLKFLFQKEQSLEHNVGDFMSLAILVRDGWVSFQSKCGVAMINKKLPSLRLSTVFNTNSQFVLGRRRPKRSAFKVSMEKKKTYFV